MFDTDNQITFCVLTQHSTALRNVCGSFVRCKQIQNESPLPQTPQVFTENNEQ
jgi:hypothetical protein